MPCCRRYITPFLKTLVWIAIVATAVPSAVLWAAKENTTKATLLSLTEVIVLVSTRYEGRALDTDIEGPKKHEPSSVVYELRWLTPKGAVLKIRLDAYSGAFLSIDGRGQLEALKPMP